MNRKITMVSLYASSAKYDFLILKDELQQKYPQYEIGYFLGNMEAKEKNHVRSMLYEAKKLRNDDSDWIGLEGFLPDELVQKHKQNKRYLLLEPFDNLFSMKWSNRKWQQYLEGYTHVIVPSAYWYDKIKRFSKKMDIEIISDCRLPFFDKVADETYVKLCRQSLDNRYPNLAGKKLIYINLNGQRVNPKRNDYTEINMGKLLDSISEDYMIVTNSMNLRYASRHLDSIRKDKFLFVEGKTMEQELLACACSLLSNNAYSCSVFASTKRPFSVVQFNNNCFEQFMIKNYKDICVSTSGQIENMIISIIDPSYRILNIKEIIMQGKKSVMEVLEYK